jgi:hypothetical protein
LKREIRVRERLAIERHTPVNRRYLWTLLSATSERNQEQYRSNCRTEHGGYGIANETNGQDKIGKLRGGL